MNQSPGYNVNLKKHAQTLRKCMTPEESHLWYDYLRTYPIQFKRQRPIAGYIADFYCPQARLVIEVDGSQHFTTDGRAYDEARTEIIERYGIKVIRFTNREIKEQFIAVCTMIDFHVKALLS